jgi:hypothetical protein
VPVRTGAPIAYAMFDEAAARSGVLPITGSPGRIEEAYMVGKRSEMKVEASMIRRMWLALVVIYW